jgi:hypothetical protein
MHSLMPYFLSPLILASALGSARLHAAGASPVLVELFTSEGCSSCPPADAFSAELEGTRSAAGAEVIVLGEHVDYWNHLGWTDPYSSPAFSRRQQAYAAAFGLTSVYTPQMVIDGASEKVGSDRNGVRQAIAEAAGRPKATVSLGPAQGDGGQACPLWIKVEGLRPGPAETPVALYLAVAEDRLESQVARGENAGRRLTHAAVVRRLTRIAVLGPGEGSYATTVRVPLDPAWKRKDLRAVAFVQSEARGRILGAASARLPDPGAPPAS